MSSFDAVVLAGGAAQRLGGIDKPAVTINGTTLLDRAIEAVAGATSIIVVGTERPTALRVEWTLEQPPLAGPVAALAAGIVRVAHDRVVVLASDLPFVDRETVDGLALASRGHEGAVAVDDSGILQPLLGLYSTDVLRARLASRPRSMRDLIEGLELVEVDVGRAAEDCDTWEDIEAAREVGQIA